MQPTITCRSCGEKLSIDEALLHEIREELSRDQKKQLKSMEEKIRREAAEDQSEKIKQAEERAAEQAGKKLTEQLTTLKEELDEERTDKKQLREEQKELMQQIRKANQAKETAELEMQKKLAEEEKKIREEAEKSASEKSRLHLAERDKTIGDLQKALEEAQRKAAQGSQQMQGEILELDLEDALSREFRDDDIQPVEKGISGADVKQTVKSPRGTVCGTILWESKRTKSWSDQWPAKLKADMRAAGANCPAIITEVMPKEASADICRYQGVWVCRPGMAIVLARLLRDGLLAAGRERAIAQHRGTAADALYSYITSHEFAHHIEATLETYQDMHQQISAERRAMERIWKKREAQLDLLTTGIANIYGSMEGRVGSGSMPKVKGMELLEPGEEPESTTNQEEEE